MTHESAFRSLRTSTEHLEILVGQVPKRRFSRRTLAFVISSFVVMAMFADLGSWIHGPATYLSSCSGTCQADPTEAASYLSHTAYSLLHLHNPFLTNFYNYPMGVNMMDNDFMPLIGLLAMPLTLSIGPTAAINILVVVGFSSSATAAFFAFARWTSWTPAAYLGALLYGFSPFMVSQGQAHFLFLLAPIPPLVLILLDDILVRQERRAIRSGIALGLLVSAQLLISPEIMATMVLISVIGIALLVLFHWRRLRDRLHHAARALSVAAGTAMVVSAYPLWLFLFGPEHVVGPAQPRVALNVLSNDLVSVLLPSQVQRISPSSALRIVNTIAPLSTWSAENGAYIGIPLLFILALCAIRYWRFGIVRFASTMGLVSLVLSLGPTLNVDGHSTGLPLPFRIVSALPLMSSVVASRLSFFVGLFFGLLLAVGLDQFRKSGFWHVHPGRQSAIAAAVVAVVALVPVIPAWPYPYAATAVPAFFSSDTASVVPNNSVLLTYPFPDWPYAQPMYWQALSGFRFKIPGGYLYSATPTGRASLYGTPSVTASLLQGCAEEQNPQASSSDEVNVANDLRRWDISTIVVTDVAPDPQCALQVFTAVLGRSAHFESEVWVWSGVQADLRSVQP